MIFDTDIIVWVERGNVAAAELVYAAKSRFLALYSLLELLQLAPSKAHQRLTKDFLEDFAFEILPLTETIAHRALIYVEEFSCVGGLRAGDALVAATAVENNLPLVTSNYKHYKLIKDLQMVRFAPRR